MSSLLSVRRWSVFCLRNPQWREVVPAIQAAGPEFKPARTETLSDYLEPVGSSRHGGLYLAQQSTQRERRLVAAAATGELSLGGTHLLGEW